MLKIAAKIVLVTIGTAIALPVFSIKPSLSQTYNPNPSLGNGIMCVARGKTEQAKKVYFYTSVIDDNSIARKQPVSVSIVKSVQEITEGELVILDKPSQSLLIEDFAAATPPQMEPVGLAITTYQGSNTFRGKTQAGTPVSFSLDNNFRTFNLTHGNETYKGVCH